MILSAVSQSAIVIAGLLGGEDTERRIMGCRRGQSPVSASAARASRLRCGRRLVGVALSATPDSPGCGQWCAGRSARRALRLRLHWLRVDPSRRDRRFARRRRPARGGRRDRLGIRPRRTHFL